MTKEHNRLAREILTSNQYMTIGSSDKQGRPWTSPVVYCYDDDAHLYFISLPTSKHAQNFSANENVALAIFDSHQEFGEGVGLQIEGTVKKVSPLHLPMVIRLFLQRTWPFMNNRMTTSLAGIKKVISGGVYQAYEVIPTKVWMNDPDSSSDVRVEVSLVENK